MHWKSSNKIITVYGVDGIPLFYALDDCFGLERVQVWAQSKGIDYHLIPKGV